MTCEEWQDEILDEEFLSDLRRRDLHLHMSSCVNCRAWAEALAGMEESLKQQLKSEASPSSLRPLVLRAVARERRSSWVAAAPELLDGLGWGAVGVLGMAALMFWTNWPWLDHYLVWMGAAAVAGSAGWAGGVLRKEKSEARLVL